MPIDLVASTANQIRLRCTESEFHILEDAEETQFLPGASAAWGYEQEQMLSLPYYPLGVGMGMGGMGMSAGLHAIITGRVPVG